MTFSTVVILTKGNFAPEAFSSATPVLVYFWAEWCGRCKTIGPVLDALADRYEDRVKIGTINVDEQPALVARYEIRAIPTLLLLREGRVADQIAGLRTGYEVEDWFGKVLV